MQNWDLNPVVWASEHTLLTTLHLHPSGNLQNALLKGKTGMTHIIEDEFIKPATKVMMASCWEEKKNESWPNSFIKRPWSFELMLSESFTAEYEN